MKPLFLLTALCGVALLGAGCGDDNKTLSYDDTGAEIGKACDSVDFEGAGLTGDAKNDAPKLGAVLDDFEQAIQDVRDLDVDEELADDRDAFADNGEQQLSILKD